MTIICALCGKSNIKISKSKGICLDCYRKEELVYNIDQIKLTICPSCYSIRTKTWKKIKTLEDINAYVTNYILKRIKIMDDIEIKNLSFNLDKDLSHGFVDIVLNLNEFDEQIELSKYIEIHTTKKLCEDCLKIKTENYSAILQIRDNDLFQIEKMQKDIEEMLKENIIQEIIKLEKYSFGTDIYFLHTNIARRIAKILAKKYYGKYEESYSVKTGNKYIYTILLDMR
jgi:NMD protein affecting ribosome stability and mRNA decay